MRQRSNSLAQSYRCRRLSEYCMRQRTTAVDQPPFSPVFNMANNTLDGFDVSKVQGPILRVKRNRRGSISGGSDKPYLPNKRETNNFMVPRFKLIAFRDREVRAIPEVAAESAL